ncbi:hypothetical protein NT01EI_1944 [Edwardsiella ictaluri 93-146]|uniref:Uncharacterized protein n=1 Tax=Edwardsiella ictaluri (strain 93-146) TaxID=634503 RepID=C5B9Z9_EDWI9|nr:hypothetical protein NT01EI_1944 [Edwardsiella ictaluri 93-146]
MNRRVIYQQCSQSTVHYARHLMQLNIKTGCDDGAQNEQ